MLEMDDDKTLSFKEESRFLDSVESRIDALIQPFDRRIKVLSRELSNWHPVDYEDIDRKRISSNDLERNQERKLEIEAFKPSPYFCHFDLEIDGGETREFCIGEQQHDLRDDSGSLVLSWTSPLRKVYTNKTQRHFEFERDGEVHTYDLRLRRMVTINDGALVSVNTEFDSSDDSLDGLIIDSFLLDVLRDKRRDYKLSNIIKTIQQNQNDVLERPIDESFVVQGCAGSGKTMILLHRIAYLAANHPEIDFAGYIVLTPNEAFNTFIDELCSELLIGTITRLTVESYYVRLARILSRNDTRIIEDARGKSVEVPKIVIPAENVISELDLPAEYLSEVYSVEFAQWIEELFQSKREAVFKEMEAGLIKDLFAKKSVTLPRDNETLYDSYLAITRACRAIKRESVAALDRVRVAKTNRDEIAEELEKVSSAYSGATEVLEPFRAAVTAKAIPEYATKRQRLDDYQRRITSVRSRVKRASDLVEAASAEYATADELRVDAERNLVAARDLASRDVGYDEAAADSWVMEQVDDGTAIEREEVARLQAELDDIGLLNFGRRRRKREELEQAESRLHALRDDCLKAAVEEYTARINAERANTLQIAEREHSKAEQIANEAQNKLADLSQRQQDVQEELDALRGPYELLKADVELLKRSIEAFDMDRYPNLATVEELDALKDVSPELFNYAVACRQLPLGQARYLRRGEQRISILAKRLEAADEDLEDAEALAKVADDQGVLESAERLAMMLDASVFNGALDEELKDLRARYGVAAPQSSSYRHDLYLRALACVLYYGPASDVISGMCIDEAQDLSIAELKLIRAAVGSRAPINLYGDVNQSILPYKGIKDWSDLPDDIAASKFELNENYRNTLQITEYCNQRLNMDVTPVGIRGPEVTRLGLSAAIDEMFALRDANPGSRCAILYKRGLSGVRERLVQLLGSEAQYGVVDVSKVSVIPVEAAKGLEFETVVVIDNGMSRNERYLSFTRALTNLFVTHVKGAEVGAIEEIATNTGRTVGASKLHVADIRPLEQLPKDEKKLDEPEDDPFYDLDFS